MMISRQNRKMVKLAISLFLALFFLTGFNQAETFEKCVSNHRKNIEICLNKTVKHINLNSCYEQAQKVQSNIFKEDTLSYCFNEIAEFPTLKTCLQKAHLFGDANNHDNGMFSCYMQFQNSVSFKQCQQVAKLMRLPEKEAYLSRHCENLK